MNVDFHSVTEHFERVHTRRLALRAATLADSWPLYQATRNPLFNQHLLWDQPDDEASVIDRIDAIVAAARNGRLSALSAVVKTTGEWVSLYRFQPYAANPSYLEMGIWTHDRFWHGRYSLELVRGCIDAAFELLDMPVLVGAASLENRSSCKLMQLSGMTASKLVHRRNEAQAEVALQEFEISREEWASSRKRPVYEQVAVRAPRSAGAAAQPAAARYLARLSGTGPVPAVRTPGAIVRRRSAARRHLWAAAPDAAPAAELALEA